MCAKVKKVCQIPLSRGRREILKERRLQASVPVRWYSKGGRRMCGSARFSSSRREIRQSSLSHTHIIKSKQKTGFRRIVKITLRSENEMKSKFYFYSLSISQFARYKSNEMKQNGLFLLSYSHLFPHLIFFLRSFSEIGGIPEDLNRNDLLPWASPARLFFWWLSPSDLRERAERRTRSAPSSYSPSRTSQ